MKKIILSIVIAIILLPSNSIAQCEERKEVFKCAQFFGDSIIFLNDFKVNNPKRKVKEDSNGKEWDIYLMKNTEYRFAMCCKSLSKISMKLYCDSISENNPLLSTYMNGKNQRYFDFICMKSALYKVSIRFKKENVLNKELDAMGIVGFIKKIE